MTSLSRAATPAEMPLFARDPRTLRSALDRLARRYDRRWVDTDPVAWPRRFPDPDDREVVAVLAALLAYGRVASIDASLRRVLGVLGSSPARAIRQMPARELSRRLRTFAHRWTTGSDVAWLLSGLAALRNEHGSLGAFLVGHRAERGAALRTALAAWRDASVEYGGARGTTARRRRARSFLLPDVRSGTACKRLLLLARWGVRPDDGIDLGLWAGPSLTPADLLVPLDVHAHRIARHLGLTERPRADWRAVEEVTAAFRRLDPRDPVRYDFALARPGIVGRCRHRHEPDVCRACDLRNVCRHGRGAASPTTT